MKRSSRAIGWCPPCRKLLYSDRKTAKKVARAHREHKSEYPCPEQDNMWHVGGVPELVIRGEMTRAEYYKDVS